LLFQFGLLSGHTPARFKLWTGQRLRLIFVFMLFGKVLLLKLLLGFGFGMIILALL
jgi:hypothetical protein